MNRRLPPALAALLLPLLVFALGLALTVVAARTLQRIEADQAHADFSRTVQRVADEVSRRFGQPVYGLNGLRGLFTATPQVTRDAFSSFVLSRDLAREFPGVRGFGFAQAVSQQEVPRFVAEQREDQAPDFTPRRLQPHDHDQSLLVKYVQPMADNAGARGLDLASEPRRHAAALEAAASGQATLSAAITLVQDQRQTPGALLYLPVYSPGPAPTTAAERQGRLAGLLFSPIVLDELLKGLQDVVDRQVELALLDGDDPAAPGAQVFRTGGFDTAAAPGPAGPVLHTYRAERRVEVPGRRMVLQVHSMPAFEARFSSGTRWLVLAGGSLASALLGLLLWTQASGRRRAEALAREMTVDLDRLAEVVRHTSNAVSITDAAQRITWVNEGFSRLSGYSLADARGKTHGELLGSGQSDPQALQRLADAGATGTGCRVEVVNRAKDGRLYWQDTELQPLRDALGRLTGFMEVGSDVTERLKAQQRLQGVLTELAQERQRLQDILSGTRAATWEWHVASGELVTDAQWVGLMGRSREEMSPMTMQTVIRHVHPDDLVAARQAMQAHLAGHTDYFECEQRTRHRDGHWVWVLDRGRVASRDAQGAPERVAGTRIDISERKHAEAALRESEALLDKTGRIGGVGGWVLDLASGTVQLSDQSCRMLDMPLGQVLTLPQALAQIGQDRAAAFEQAVRQCVGQGAGFDLELPVTTGAGRDIWLRAVGEPEHGLPQAGTRGRVLRLVGAFQDTSARHAAQAEVQRSAALLRAAIDAVDEAFVLYDPEDRLVFCNDKYLQTYAESAAVIKPGNTFEQIIRHGAERGLYRDSAQDAEQWVAQRMAAHRAANSNLTQRLADGRSVRIVERRLPDGHTVGFRIDITELVRATDAAEAASVAKSRFLANMSHEIRTPMNAVLGMLRLLRRTELGARQADYAAKAETAARSLLGLLNDILDFSKVEAGKLDLEAQPFALDQLLGELAVLMSATVGDKPVAVLYDIDPGLPRWLVGDALRLQQVLVNLCGNAVKFTAQGEVRIEVKALPAAAPVAGARPPVRLHVAVHDTGIGIAADQLDHVFDGFAQAEASTTRRFGGTGLGLAISRRLVALMGGELRVHSTPGQGSRFWFDIALDQADPALPAPPAEPPGPASGLRLAGLRLLLVEDNPNNQQIASELLTDEGATVHTVGDGAQALAALAADAPAYDAVLMDLQMPVMDGLTATRLIRLRPALAALPVVAMTANAMEADRLACLAAGMNAHVGKPFDIDHLVQVLRQQLGLDSPATAPKAPPRAGGGADASARAAAAAAGVELDQALARLGGKRAAYRRLLAGMLQDLGGLPEQLHAALGQADTQPAQRLLHTLRGVAATLGAMALADAVAQAERALALAAASDADSAAGLAPPWPQALLAQVQSTRGPLAALLAALPASDHPAAAPATAGQAADADPLPATALDLPALHQALRTTAQHLGNADMAAMESLALIQQRFGPALGARLLPLDNAVHALDFDRALALCQDLITTTA